MEQLLSWLADPAIRLVGIWAVGGFGKSTLAAKLCELATKFDQILWVNFKQAYSFALWGRWLMQRLGIEVEASVPDEQLATVMINQLATQRYLLVLDNLETLLEQNQQWLDPGYQTFLMGWLQSQSPSTLLVTTREQPILPTNVRPACRWKRLGGLSLEAGVALLTSQGVRERGVTDGPELRRFVELADGHPLLLNLAAGLLLDEEGDEPDIRALKRGEVNLYQLVGLHRGDPEASVETVLRASLSRLEPRLQTLLYHASVYRRPFNQLMAQVMIDHEQMSEKTLRALVKRSLLQEQKQGGQWWFQFQPLVQRYLRQTADDQRQAHQQAIAWYGSQAQPLLGSVKAVALVPYLEAVHHLCELGHYAAAWSVMQRQTDETFEYSSPGMFLQFKGSGTDRVTLRDLYSRLIAEWQPQDRNEEIQRSDALKAIGDVLQFLKQSRDALSRYDEALGIYRDVGDRLGEANTLQAIGDVLQFLKQSRDALSRYDEALGIYRDVGARLGEANTLSGQGNVYRSLGEVEQAVNCHQEALYIHRSIGARASEAFALWALGKDYDASEQYSMAIEIYHQSLEIYRQIGAQFSQAVLWRAIGDSFANLDQAQDAQSAYEEASIVYRSIGMEDDAEACQVLSRNLKTPKHK